MTSLLIFHVILLCSLSLVGGTEITAPIFVPIKREGKGALPEKLKPLILFFQKSQPNDFIASGDASILKWKLSKVVLIADGIISVSFDEGHVIVTGVLELDELKKEWVIRVEDGGEFKHKTFSSLTGRPMKRSSRRR